MGTRKKGTVSKIARLASVAARSRKVKRSKRLEISASERHRRAGIARLAAAPGPARILRIPITNVLDGSDYSARLYVGSTKAAVDVILDTGSSTLAVDPSVYDGRNDKNLKTTTYGQLVLYGTGGWAGPVVDTSLSFGDPKSSVTLGSAPVAIAAVQQPGNFEGVKGIMGLAYNGLNAAYDFKSYFAKLKKPQTTYPWPFPGKNFKTFSVSFNDLIKTNKVPEPDITPYFDELEDNHVVANKFAFYTLRSWVSMRAGSEQAVTADPLNQGFFILGGGEEQTDLYQGSFVNVDVLDDLYYNTNLKSVQVDGCAAVAAAPLQSQYRDFMISNSIIDSGTSDLSLAGDVYQAILNSLSQLNPTFRQAITEYSSAATRQQGIPASSLKLAAWPNIYFTLSGENGEDVRLTCSPQTYWQMDFPRAGQAAFQISGPLDPANQSILGLPLMNNYYTVFDRSLDSKGVVRFAPIKLLAGS
jgi:hypothetical protein